VASGKAVMELVKSQLRPRDIVTRKALENAAAVVAATGGSTNAGLHLPAIAAEAGIDFDLFDVCEVMRRTPYIADLKPGGRYVAKDLFEAGGVGIVIHQLLEGGYMHGDCLTVTGKTLAENYGSVKFPTDQDVVRPISKPLSKTGGVVRKARSARSPACTISSSAGRRASSSARRIVCRRSSRASMKRAMCWSFAMRGRRAGRACARCCRPPARCTARTWARRWR